MFQCESFMIDSQGMQNSGIEIVDMNRVFQNVVGIVIGFTVVKPLFETAARCPGAEATTMMIS